MRGFCFSIMVFFILGIATAVSAAPLRVAILPFQINADKNYSFLQNGITDMLTSRLAWADKVEVIDPVATAQALTEIKGFKDDSLALMAGAKLKADYVLRGSITLFGDSVSIDARMLNVTGNRPPLTFFKQTQTMGQVIPEINQLATEINTKIFNRNMPAAPAVSAPAQPPAAPAQQSNVRMNPNNLIQNGQLLPPESVPAPGAETSSAPAGQTSSALNPAFITAGGARTQGPEFWKSHSFAYLINGLAIGDVNKDGKNEIVLASPHALHIFQVVQHRMRALKTINTGKYGYNIGVDIADINGNGTPEIFVSRYNNQQNVLESIVYEYDGKDYKPIVKDAHWYFRVVHPPDRGLTLLGQHQPTGDNDPLTAPIMQLTWQSGNYQPNTQILPAYKANLLGLDLGDVMNDKSEVVIASDPYDKLRILKKDGTEVWTSADYFGGSLIYYAMPPTSMGDMKYKFYLPVRVRIADLDKNHKYEVIAAKNFGATGRALSQQRFFDTCQMTALVWDGLGLSPVWKTRKLSGRIQDFAIADYDNDGKPDLVAAIISKEGAIIGTTPKSAIIAYKLNKR